MRGAWDLIVACQGSVVVAWRRASLRAGLAGLLAAINGSRRRHYETTASSRRRPTTLVPGGSAGCWGRVVLERDGYRCRIGGRGAWWTRTRWTTSCRGG